MRQLPAVPLALFALLAGCGQQTLIAGLFINTPAVQSPLDPTQKFGPYTALLSYVANIDTSNPTNISASSVTPVTGVQATVNFESCIGAPDAGGCVASGEGGTPEVIPIPESGDGLYELVSSDSSSSLTFEQGVTYTMILQIPDGADFDAYGARFQPGPPAHMLEFADKSVPLSRATTDTTDLIVHRDDPVGSDGRPLPAAVLVGTIDPNNPAAQPNIVYKSLDYEDPKTLLLLALSDEPYRVSQFDIPASVFSSSGYYVVTMISITEGKASANAFVASIALAGSGDAGLVIVQ